MLEPSLKKNDTLAIILITVVSLVVFAAVTFLGNYTVHVNLPFSTRLFATANAYINSAVALLLVAGLGAVKQKKYALHKNIMQVAILLSVLFLVSYIAHHLLTDPTKYGDANHDGVTDAAEKLAVGGTYKLYYILLLTHIPLAGIILPFILFSAYRALIGEYSTHKKLVRITWPIWLYVAITGPIIYLLISPYYT